MANKQASIIPRPGARAEKRKAIMEAARAVFGREGYSRASIDVIAETAGVSTRTIYNHFPGKEQLFATVLEASAAEVAEAFEAEVDREAEEKELIPSLVDLAVALIVARSNNRAHFAMVRQINAEAGHFPPEMIEAWHAAGPTRIETVVARRLADHAEAGELSIPVPRRAAAHFIAITAAEVSDTAGRRAQRLTQREIVERVTAGVEAFVHGYGLDSSRS